MLYNGRYQLARDDAVTAQPETKQSCQRRFTKHTKTQCRASSWPEHNWRTCLKSNTYQRTDMSFSEFPPSCSTPLRRQRSPCCPWSSPSLLAQSTHQLTDKTLLTTSAQYKHSRYSSLPPQLLHDARDDAPRSTARAHSVLVGHRQQVALLHGKLAVCMAHILHVIGHLVVALCLLGKLGLRTLPVRHKLKQRLAASQPSGKVHVLLTGRHGCKRP